MGELNKQRVAVAVGPRSVCLSLEAAAAAAAAAAALPARAAARPDGRRIIKVICIGRRRRRCRWTEQTELTAGEREFEACSSSGSTGLFSLWPVEKIARQRNGGEKSERKTREESEEGKKREFREMVLKSVPFGFVI